MTRRLLLIGVIFSLMITGFLKAEEKPATTIGHKAEIFSKILNETRQLSVYLPETHGETLDAYPVIYLLDGTSDWLFIRVVTSVESLVSQGKIPECIIVGIDGSKSLRDYFPHPLSNRPESGQAATFRAFIIKELKPFIDSVYRTSSYTILAGGSNAGLFTFDTYLKSPEVFNSYIAASPSVGYADTLVKRLTDSITAGGFATNPTLYINYTDNDIPRLVTNHIDSIFTPLNQAASSISSVLVELLPGEGHVPFASWYRGLAHTFPDYYYSRDETIKFGLSRLAEHYQKLTQKYDLYAKPPEMLLTHLYVHHYREEEYTDANEVLTFTISLYPESYRSFYFKALVVNALGNRKDAVMYMKEALVINPDFPRARETLNNWEKDTN